MDRFRNQDYKTATSKAMPERGLKRRADQKKIRQNTFNRNRALETPGPSGTNLDTPTVAPSTARSCRSTRKHLSKAEETEKENQRYQDLLKWKEKRRRIKELVGKHKKPQFHTGVVKPEKPKFLFTEDDCGTPLHTPLKSAKMNFSNVRSTVKQATVSSILKSTNKGQTPAASWNLKPKSLKFNSGATPKPGNSFFPAKSRQLKNPTPAGKKLPVSAKKSFAPKGFKFEAPKGMSNFDLTKSNKTRKTPLKKTTLKIKNPISPETLATPLESDGTENLKRKSVTLVSETVDKSPIVKKRKSQEAEDSVTTVESLQGSPSISGEPEKSPKGSKGRRSTREPTGPTSPSDMGSSLRTRRGSSGAKGNPKISVGLHGTSSRSALSRTSSVTSDGTPSKLEAAEPISGDLSAGNTSIRSRGRPSGARLSEQSSKLLRNSLDTESISESTPSKVDLTKSSSARTSSRSLRSRPSRTESSVEGIKVSSESSNGASSPMKSLELGAKTPPGESSNQESDVISETLDDTPIKSEESEHGSTGPCVTESPEIVHPVSTRRSRSARKSTKYVTPPTAKLRARTPCSRSTRHSRSVHCNRLSLGSCNPTPKSTKRRGRKPAQENAPDPQPSPKRRSSSLSGLVLSPVDTNQLTNFETPKVNLSARKHPLSAPEMFAGYTPGGSQKSVRSALRRKREARTDTPLERMFMDLPVHDIPPLRFEDENDQENTNDTLSDGEVDMMAALLEPSKPKSPQVSEVGVWDDGDEDLSMADSPPSKKEPAKNALTPVSILKKKRKSAKLNVSFKSSRILRRTSVAYPVTPLPSRRKSRSFKTLDEKLPSPSDIADVESRISLLPGLYAESKKETKVPIVEGDLISFDTPVAAKSSRRVSRRLSSTDEKSPKTGSASPKILFDTPATEKKKTRKSKVPIDTPIRRSMRNKGTPKP